MYGGDSSRKAINMASQIRGRPSRSFPQERIQSIRKRIRHSKRNCGYSIRNFDGKRIRFALTSQSRSEANSSADHEFGGRSLHKDGQYLLHGPKWSI